MNQLFEFLGSLGLLCYQIVHDLIKKKIPWVLVWNQVFFIGHKSFPLVFVTAASVGSVMALQFGLGLEKFGGKLYVPRLVTVSILRELGPVFAGLMLAARVGAGIASEIGSMVVSQQIDAIRALGTSPIQKIVIPRVLACLISVPILIGVANVIGFLGGLLIGSLELGLDPQFYILKAFTNMKMADYFAGFCKSFFFALFVAIPSCHYGLNVEEGTRGVGNATTKAVVTGSIFIFVGDYFLTKLFWIIEVLS